MAKPRIFISSTYFDLRNVRADLDRFIRAQGYEPVLFERGHIAYGKETSLEKDCYREISTCDILINLVGGKFGSEAKDSLYSISQQELKIALELGKQIYIFVERPVLSEYQTYLKNKENGFVPVSVNDIRVFEFIEEIYSLSGRNPVQGFEISEEIVTFLKKQWAGLFQTMLSEFGKQPEIKMIQKIESTAETLNNLVNFLTQEREAGDQAIKDILLSTHPAFESIKQKLKIPYKVSFDNLSDLDALLNARSTTLLSADDDFRTYKCEWFKDQEHRLKISSELFDEQQNLLVIKPSEWKDEYIELNEYLDFFDDDIPF